MKDKETLIVYGEKLGRVDLENLIKHLEKNKYTQCRLILPLEPVKDIKAKIDADSRIEFITAKRPKREAKGIVKEFKESGVPYKLARLEEVSDRSLDRGGC